MAVATGRERRDDASLDELDALARSAGLLPVARRIFRRPRPDAATHLGSGSVESFGVELDALDPAVVLFDHPISAVQQRNLERAWKRSVSDRTELIIDIFSQRARSSEGKLQVELARLEHQASRLVRMWSHLERQRGGIGLRGGPGERQIELDRRMIDERIKRLRERLRKVERQRVTRRRSRNRGPLPQISLIGYTNAGKSTLFNRLTRAGALAADQLFATLDPLTRRVRLVAATGVAVSFPAAGETGGGPSADFPGAEHLADDATAGEAGALAAGGAPAAPMADPADPGLGPEVLFSDTVGFVRDLPHGLVAAFRATLEETAQADLLLHVVDADSPDREAQIAAVERVLEEIGAADIPQWQVLNKIDRTGISPGERRDASGKVNGFAVSALTGSGIAELRRALSAWAASPDRDSNGDASSRPKPTDPSAAPVADEPALDAACAETALEPAAAEPHGPADDIPQADRPIARSIAISQ